MKPDQEVIEHYSNMSYLEAFASVIGSGFAEFLPLNSKDDDEYTRRLYLVERGEIFIYRLDDLGMPETPEEGERARKAIIEYLIEVYSDGVAFFG